MKKFSCLLVLLCVLLIFSFSIRSGASSHMESLQVKTALAHFGHHLGIGHINFKQVASLFHDQKLATGEGFVRKVAHLSEYFLLGLIATFAANKIKRGGKIRPRINFWLGPAVALADELIIQTFFSKGRTPSLIDVAIDSTGYFLGAAVMGLLLTIGPIRRKRKLKRA